jgi:hypothetical protein
MKKISYEPRRNLLEQRDESIVIFCLRADGRHNLRLQLRGSTGAVHPLESRVIDASDFDFIVIHKP